MAANPRSVVTCLPNHPRNEHTRNYISEINSMILTKKVRLVNLMGYEAGV